MSRPLRIEFAGGLYHVTSRGDGREAIFLGKEDRRLFLGVLAEVVPACNWTVQAYCLMDNHYHLLIETPDGNLSKGIRQVSVRDTPERNLNNADTRLREFAGPSSAVPLPKPLAQIAEEHERR